VKFHQPSKNYVSYLRNEIITSWDRGEAFFFPLLFHEATHQLLNGAVGKRFPIWLTEGLAEYFQTAVFDGQNLYLLPAYWNPMSYEVAPFLKSGGDPKEIFSWTDYDGSNVGAYYGLSGSFLWYLMRNPEYRPLLTDCFNRLSHATSADHLYPEVFGKMKDPFWVGWANLIASNHETAPSLSKS